MRSWALLVERGPRRPAATRWVNVRVGGPRPPPGGLTCAPRSTPPERVAVCWAPSQIARMLASACGGLWRWGPRGGRVNPLMRSWALLVEPGPLCPAATRWVNVRIGGPRPPPGGLTCAAWDATERAPGARLEADPEHAHNAARSMPRSAAHNAPRYHRVDFRNASYVVIPARCSSHPFSRRHAAIDISAGQSPFNSMSPSLPGGALTRHHQGSMLWVDPRRSP